MILKTFCFIDLFISDQCVCVCEGRKLCVCLYVCYLIQKPLSLLVPSGRRLLSHSQCLLNLKHERGQNKIRFFLQIN